MAYGALSVLVTATLVPRGATKTTVYNNGATTVYRGTDASVTTSTGMPILPGGSYTFVVPVAYLIGSATTEVRWSDE